MFATRHRVYWSAAFCSPPTPQIGPRGLALLDMFEDVFSPIGVPRDIAETDEHLVGSFRHPGHGAQVGVQSITIVPFTVECALHPGFILSR